jgi:ribosomal protein L44E
MKKMVVEEVDDWLSQVSLSLSHGLEFGVGTGKRRYDRKQSGYGGQTKPVFHKKVCAKP